MIDFRVFGVMLGICCFVTRISFAQQRDSVEIIKTDSVEILKVDTTSKIIEKVTDTKLSKELLKSVTRKSKENIINTRSEEAFLPYEGKIIREIYINHLDFEKKHHRHIQKYKELACARR